MAAQFASRLLGWYEGHRRELPWRQSDDPWAIWVSEIMLQQTRVEVVRHIYPEFMARYPRPLDFAAVSDDELLAAWRGLGYYRRARLLRAGAQAVVSHHQGQVPDDLAALGSLPGIGAYTKGAVASIAFEKPVTAVDSNVERVIARHHGIEDPVKTGLGKKLVHQATEECLDRNRPGDFNQALMELGATVCTPKSPRCDDCPVREDCRARRLELIDVLPVLPRRRAVVEVQARAVLVSCRDGLVLGCRVGDGEINSGQIDLPGPGPLVDHAAGGEELETTLRDRFGLEFVLEAELGSVRHGITHHRIRMTVHWASVTGRRRRPLVSASPGDPAVPWTTLARKAFALAGLPGAAP